MTNESQRHPSLLLVDALNLIRRVYAAQPGEDGPERAEGAKVSSVQSMDDLEGKLGERLRNHATTARLCHTLIGLRTDLELGTNLSDLRYLPTDVQGRTS